MHHAWLTKFYLVKHELGQHGFVEPKQQLLQLPQFRIFLQQREFQQYTIKILLEHDFAEQLAKFQQ